MATAKPASRLTKVSGKLKGVSEAKASTTVLLKDIQKHVHAKAMADERSQIVIHPSEMAKEDWCPRQTFLRIQHYTANPDKPLDSGRSYSFQSQSVFETGNTAHRKYQNWLAEMGRLYGEWVNRDSGLIVVKTLSAEEYATGKWQYREVPLRHEAIQIAGHADGIVEDLASIIEIKTVGVGTLRWEAPTWLNTFRVMTEDGKEIYDLDEAWKQLRSPLPSHIKQANIYGYLARESGVDVERALFIYEFKGTQGVKEFPVKLKQSLIQKLLDQAVDITFRLDNGKEAPPKPDQSAPDARMCKGCPFFQECWPNGTSGTVIKAGRDSEPRKGKSRSEAADGTPGSRRTRQAAAANPRGSRRAHRPDGRRADGSVQSTNPLGELPGRAVGGGGGGRKVRASRP